MRKIGINGGTFDPIHIGHIKSAENVFIALDLDEVVFIPTGNPPHKVSNLVTDETHRFEMVKLAIEGNDKFKVSNIEVNRKGYSYTIDTLKELKKQYEEKYGDVKFYYIIGTDVLAEIQSWKDSKEVFKICEFAVLKRPGYAYSDAKIKAVQSGALIHEIYSEEIDISSTEIRDKVKRGESIEKYVPQKVYEYILNNGLYKENKILGFENIKEDIKKRLSEKRFTHSLGVMDECIRLGKIYGADIEKCRLAGLLHDCAKEMSVEQYKWMGINVEPTKQDLINGYNRNILHAKAGRIVAEQRYGIIDEEVLNAIEYHVTGRPGMELLEQIVFLADYTEINRSGEVFDRVREAVDKGLIYGLVEALDSTIIHVLNKRLILGTETVLTRNYYLSEIQNMKKGSE